MIVHSILAILIYVTNVVQSQNCDTSRYHLIVINIGDDSSDAIIRLKNSAKNYGLDFDVNDSSNEAKELSDKLKIIVQLIKESVKSSKEEKEIIILLIEGLSVIINDNEKTIICKFLDAVGDRRLLLPSHSDVNRFSQSLLCIGFASDTIELLHYLRKRIDNKQPIFNNLTSDGYLNDQLYISTDSNGELFQNVDSSEREVILKFEDNGDAKVYNVMRDKYPSVIFCTQDGHLYLNYLGNYIGGSWSANDGCRGCSSKTKLTDIKEDNWPSVTLALFIAKPTLFVKEFLEAVNKFSYPKTKIDLYVYNNQKYNAKEVEEFIKVAKKMYRSVNFDNDEDDLKEKEARKTAFVLAKDASNDFAFLVDGFAQLINPDSLRLLIENSISNNRNILAPMVVLENKLFSNFWGMINENGFYARSEDYVEIVNGKHVGAWNVPYITGAILVNKQKIQQSMFFYNHDDEMDSDMSFCAFARLHNHFLYVDNQWYYGFIADSEGFSIDEKRLHPEIYEIFRNRYLWEKRYIHPHYFSALNGTFEITEPCPDVYDYPLMSETFTKELVEEMENFGKWSGGTNIDERITGGYENVPTVDIHMKQIDFERQWLYFLDEYVRPMQEKLFIGYYQRPVYSLMMFVVRYKQGEQPSLQAHHDASTYTVDIALNKRGRDYEGGGIRYVRYNCVVEADQVGYAAMFPGRLTHLHEGLPVTSGIRYIAVSFLNP